MDIFTEAIELWGEEAQMLMAIEEMAELTDKLTKYMRGRNVKIESLAEEVADVRIMMEQLEVILGRRDWRGNTLCQFIYDKKLERLKERIQESNLSRKTTGRDE